MTRRASDHQYADHNTLVGFTGKRGRGYHFYATDNNSYEGGVPLEEIDRRLLNWTAVESPLFVNFNQDGTGEQQIEVPGKKALVASDNGEILGIHGEGRQTRQYREALIDGVKDLLDVPELAVGSVGFLDGRKKMWINIEMAETMTVPGTDIEFSPFLLAATSHDASIAWTFKALNELIVCGNMVAPILRGRRGIGAATHKVKATRHSGLNVAKARENLGILYSNSEEFIAEVDALTKTELSNRQFQNFLDMAAPMPSEKDGQEPSKRAVTMAENRRDAMMELWNNSPMVSPWKGTAFGAFQLMNTYQHHIQAVKGEDRTRTERNLERAVKDGKGSVEEMDLSTMEMIDRVLANA